MIQATDLSPGMEVFNQRIRCKGTVRAKKGARDLPSITKDGSGVYVECQLGCVDERKGYKWKLASIADVPRYHARKWNRPGLDLEGIEE